MGGGRAKLSKEAKAFFARDMSGVKNELEDIRAHLASGELIDRDEVAVLAQRRQNAMAARDVIRDELKQADHAELVTELRSTREAMKNQGTGGTRFTNDALSLPRRTGEGDASH